MIGDRMLDTIDVRVLEKWKVELLRTVSPTTFNIERKALQAMFNIAIKWGYLVENPFKSIQKLKVQQRRLFFKDEELEKILRIIVDDIHASSGTQKKYNEKFLLLVLFLLNTGMRRSEALRLTKSNIDLSRGLIVVEFTKSKKTRLIPMNEVVKGC
jgi:integrase